jgi:hypothetical protein
MVRAFCFFFLVGSPVSFAAIKFLFRSCIWNQESHRYVCENGDSKTKLLWNLVPWPQYWAVISFELQQE